MFFTSAVLFLTIGILIIFHELGHYCVARLFNVHVLRFSIGFGPALFKFIDRRGTEWVLSMLPFGGYVKMQEIDQSNNAKGGLISSFNHQSVYKRFLIVLAGPSYNFLLAIILQSVLNFFGVQKDLAILDQPPINSFAYENGFQKGDLIRSIDGKTVQSSSEASNQLAKVLSFGKEFKVLVNGNNGKEIHEIFVRSTFQGSNTFDESELKKLGFFIAPKRNTILSVIPGDVAEKAGLRNGDIITQVCSIENPGSDTFIRIIQENGDRFLRIKIERDNEFYSILLKPRMRILNGENRGFIGIELGMVPESSIVRCNLFHATYQAVWHVSDMIQKYIKSLRGIFSGDNDWKKIGGIFTIAEHAGETARLGLRSYISYLIFVSISLGILNLLPIPTLDGGYLVYYFIEMIRGYPLSKGFIAVTQYFGLILLIFIMGLAMLNDLFRFCF